MCVSPKCTPRCIHLLNSGSKKNYVHTIATGRGDATNALGLSKSAVIHEENRRDVLMKEIDRNIVQTALARDTFFTFASISRYFPHLTSMREFIESEAYLGGLEITFQGSLYDLDANRAEKLAAVQGLLAEYSSGNSGECK